MPRPKKLEPADELGTITFEEAFRRLGETAQALEAGGLPLAQATKVYEQGMALVQRCNLLLNETQLKITQLKESYSGPDDPDHQDGRGDLDWDEAAEC